jgi:uncharacterized protein
VKAGSSRRDFIQRVLFGATLTGAISRVWGASAADAPIVDRRRLGRIGAEVSLLGLGLGGELIRGYSGNREAAHELLEWALSRGINYWDSARSYGPSEAMIAPVLTRNRARVFLASKSDSRSYDGFKRDLEKSLQVLQTDHIDLYHLHDIGPDEVDNLRSIESGAVRAAREARDQKAIKAFGVTGHSGAGILIECIKRFDPDAVLTIFPCTRPDKGQYEDELLPLARSRNVGVIAMKTIRYARQAGLPAKDLLRYALTLDGVATAIVGLDTFQHLSENAAVATSFRPLRKTAQIELHRQAAQALSGTTAPWEQPGYVDGGLLS